MNLRKIKYNLINNKSKDFKFIYNGKEYYTSTASTEDLILILSYLNDLISDEIAEFNKIYYNQCIDIIHNIRIELKSRNYKNLTEWNEYESTTY